MNLRPFRCLAGFLQIRFCASLILMAVHAGGLLADESPFKIDVSRFTQDQFGSEVKAEADGMRIKAVNPLLPPIATARDLDLTISGNQWLIVRMKAEKGEYGSLWISPKSGAWLPHGTKVESQFAFPIRADGEFHTYNVWLGDSRLMPLKEGRTYDLALSYKFRLIRSSLTGPIKQLSILPTCEPAATGVVASLAFADKPDGSPPVLVVEYAGDAIGLNRPGRKGTIAVRVRNVGGSPATGLKATFQGDEGLAFLPASLRDLPIQLKVDTVQTFYIDVDPRTAGRHRFSLELSCQEGDRTTADNTYTVEPALAAASPGVIPPPVPLKTGYDIGVWYFPGWSKLTHWVATAFAAERMPLLGAYDEQSMAAADWTIKWAVEHGINYFNFLWYVSPKPGEMHPNNRFLSDYFVKSAFLPHIQFCVGWCTDSNAKTTTEAHFNADFDYSLNHFFKLPQYKKSADGRPIYTIYSGGSFMASIGPARAKQLLAACEARAKQQGFPGVYWIGGYTEKNGEKFLAAGMSGQCYYNWMGTRRGLAGATPDGMFPVLPAESYYDDARATWDVMMRQPKLDLFLPVVLGFDDRIWHGGKTPRAFYGNSPQKFRQHLQEAKTYMDANGLKSVLIQNWSEWGEGALLGPHAQFGFDYLRAVTDVFAPGQAPAAPVGPEDVGVHTTQIKGLYDLIDFVPAWQISNDTN